MKYSKFLVLILAINLFPVPACVVVKKDNGKHKGWTKNPNNPHHPASTKTTGNGNSKGKGKK
jgi:hypothetical protein